MNVTEVLSYAESAARKGIYLKTEEDIMSYKSTRAYATEKKLNLTKGTYNELSLLCTGGYVTLEVLGKYMTPTLTSEQVSEKLLGMGILSVVEGSYSVTSATERFSRKDDGCIREYTSRLLPVLNNDMEDPLCWLDTAELIGYAGGYPEEWDEVLNSLREKYTALFREDGQCHVMLLALLNPKENKRHYVYRFYDLAVKYDTTASRVKDVLSSKGYIVGDKLTELGKTHGIEKGETIYFSKEFIPLLEELLATDLDGYVSAKELGDLSGTSSTKVHGCMLALGLLEATSTKGKYKASKHAKDKGLIKYAKRYTPVFLTKLAEVVKAYYK